jgi:hypothetical protein
MFFFSCYALFLTKISSDLYMNTAARGRETLHTRQAQPLLLFLNKVRVMIAQPRLLFLKMVGEERNPASAAVPE